MITTYLNFPGNAREAMDYYTRAFGAPPPYVMNFSDLPQEDQDGMEGMEDMVMYANIKTFFGDIMLSDDMPGSTVRPTGALWICVTHEDEEELRQVFNILKQDGRELMPLEPTFFSPLYGQVEDKFGFHWMLMLPDGEEMEPNPKGELA